MNATSPGPPRSRVIADRYVVGELLGRGGNASVFLCRDERLDRDVAIKFLRPDFLADERARHRFRREAQAAAGLSHPNIVAVYDSGEDDVPVASTGHYDSVPFMVMEYVKGQTVRQMLNANRAEVIASGDPDATAPLPIVNADVDAHHSCQPMALDEAVRIVCGVLLALEYSHSKGIVHRDIKPGNVMVSDNGDIKVMDFGIARALHDPSTQTHTQSVVGTAHYLSPEQARGQDIDERTDIYSTGCLLFELLTGRTPFVGDTPVAIAYQHVRELSPAPSEFNPDVPEALDRIVLQALAKGRIERYGSASLFRLDLERAMSGLEVRAPQLDTRVLRRSDRPSGQVPLGPTRVILASQTPATTAMPDVDTPVPPISAPIPVQRQRSERGHGFGYFMLILAVLGVLGGGIFAVQHALGRDHSQISTDVEVPSVEGKSAYEGTAQLKALGFNVVEGERQFSNVTVDTILSTTPMARMRVPAGSTITLTVSKGPAQIVVPSVIGYTQGAAESELKGEQLTVGPVEQVDDPEKPQGTVIATVPTAGTPVPIGTAVTLKMSTGMVALPDVTGKTLDSARSTLEALKLDVQVRTVVTADHPAGRVFKQDPPAGKVRQFARVTLTVAQAPPTPTASPTPTTTGPTTSPGTASPTTGPTGAPTTTRGGRNQ